LIGNDENIFNGTKSLPLNKKTSKTTVESNQNGHGENTNDKDGSTLSANGNQSESTSCDKSQSEVACSSNSLHEHRFCIGMVICVVIFIVGQLCMEQLFFF
jgi:hypothetical protein